MRPWNFPERSIMQLVYIYSQFLIFQPLILDVGTGNAPLRFRGLMDNVLRFLNGIAVFSSTWPEHAKPLARIFECLKGVKLTLKANERQCGK